MNVLMEMVAVHRNASTDRAPISAAVEMDSHSLQIEQDAMVRNTLASFSSLFNVWCIYPLYTKWSKKYIATVIYTAFVMFV